MLTNCAWLLDAERAAVERQTLKCHVLERYLYLEDVFNSAGELCPIPWKQRRFDVIQYKLITAYLLADSDPVFVDLSCRCNCFVYRTSAVLQSATISLLSSATTETRLESVYNTHVPRGTHRQSQPWNRKHTFQHSESVLCPVTLAQYTLGRTETYT